MIVTPVLIKKLAIVVAILIMSNNPHNNECDHDNSPLKKNAIMISVLIMSSSSHNKNCDHEDCNQAALTKSKSQSQLQSASKSKLKSQS